MTIADMVSVIDAKVLCGEHRLDRTVHSAFCSDLMSDVLAFVNEKTVLITGIINPQVIRTAEMLDIRCMIFVRGKIPPEAVLSQARDLGITVLATADSAFTTCGKLYEAGLRGVAIQWPESEGGA
ncbi:MAG: hypothetical protein IKW00_00485 [Clostridia bacterium]|nr:hypothetical protein [Clostridia bacterium]